MRSLDSNARCSKTLPLLIMTMTLLPSGNALATSSKTFLPGMGRIAHPRLGWVQTRCSGDECRKSSSALLFGYLSYQDKKISPYYDSRDLAMATSSSIPKSPEQSLAEELELAQALEMAQNMDREYGLCSKPSQQAWSIVDKLYERQMASSHGIDGAYHHLSC